MSYLSEYEYDDTDEYEPDLEWVRLALGVLDLKQHFSSKIYNLDMSDQILC